MYGIIYWQGQKGQKDKYGVLIKPFPYLDDDGTMVVLSTIEEADEMAYELEALKGVDARVISLAGVNE